MLAPRLTFLAFMSLGDAAFVCSPPFGRPYLVITITTSFSSLQSLICSKIKIPAPVLQPACKAWVISNHSAWMLSSESAPRSTCLLTMSTKKEAWSICFDKFGPHGVGEYARLAVSTLEIGTIVNGAVETSSPSKGLMAPDCLQEDRVSPSISGRMRIKLGLPSSRPACTLSAK